MLLGRRTYDIFAAYWPYVEGEGAPMGDAFTAVNKYVLTRGEQPLPWTNSHRVRTVDDVAALKPAGSVETGSFGQIGSARADKRQAKMKDGTV